MQAETLPFQAIPTRQSAATEQEPEKKVDSPIAGHINVYPEIQSLVKCDRRPRKWKYLKLVPGTIYRYYYDWVMCDGSVVRKIEGHQLKGIQDDRPFSQSHPNMYIGYMFSSSFGGLAAGAAGATLSGFHM